MKNSNKLALVVMMVLVASCTNIKETPKGFQFTVIHAGDGVMPKPGEFLLMDMVFKDGKDSVWNDTRKGDPLFRMVPDTASIRLEDGIQEIFRMLSKGDSVTFKIPAKTLFEKDFRQPLPKKVDPDSEFTFFIVVKQRYTREQAMKVRDSVIAVQKANFVVDRQAFLKKFVIDNKARLDTEAAVIDEFLMKKKINAVQDSSGMRYVVHELGTLPNPTLSETVMVIYKGSLMENGKEFDKSDKPVPFALTRLMNGWQIALPKFPVGTKVTLYIPPTLAYGDKANRDIPANSNLVFYLELVSIKSKQTE